MSEPSDQPKAVDLVEEEHVEEDETDHVPDFINKILENPVLLPGENEDDFIDVFKGLEFNDLGRAKTHYEYMLIAEATKLWMDLQRLDCMEKAIVMNERRPAAEAFLRKAVGISASRAADKYFVDASYKEQTDEEFESAGYAPEAIEAEAYRRAMPSLGVIHRQKSADRKALMSFLKELASRLSSRDPNKKLSRPASTRSSRKAD